MYIFNICCSRDCVSRHNGGTSGAPFTPLRVDSALSIYVYYTPQVTEQRILDSAHSTQLFGKNSKLASIHAQCSYAPFVPTVPTFAVRETVSLGIMGAPRVPPLNPSESIVLSEHYRL